MTLITHTRKAILIVIMTMFVGATATLAQDALLETGTYTIAFDETARTECADGSVETFPAADLLEAMRDTFVVESVASNQIVVDGDEFRRLQDGRYTFAQPEAIDQVQNIRFTNRYTFAVTSATSIEGIFRVDYTPEGQQSCTNFFPFSGDKTDDSTASTAMAGALPTGTFEGTYAETASNECADGTFEEFALLELDFFDTLDMMLTINADSVETRWAGEPVVLPREGSDDVFVGDPFTFENDAGEQLELTYVVEFEAVSATSLDGIFVVEVDYADGLICDEVYPFSLTVPGTPLETGTFEGTYADIAFNECTDGTFEEFASTDFFDTLDMMLTINADSVETRWAGEPVVLPREGSDDVFVGDPFTFENDAGEQLELTYIVEFEAVSATSIDGIFVVEVVYADGLICDEVYPFSLNL